MEPARLKVLELAHGCREDLRLIHNYIITLGKTNTPLEELHENLKKKIHLLTTILETDSTEILNIVEFKESV